MLYSFYKIGRSGKIFIDLILEIINIWWWDAPAKLNHSIGTTQLEQSFHIFASLAWLNTKIDCLWSSSKQRLLIMPNPKQKFENLIYLINSSVATPALLCNKDTAQGTQFFATPSLFHCDCGPPEFCWMINYCLLFAPSGVNSILWGM